MTPLAETKLVFLDVETTGLSPAMGDRVVEIAMLATEGSREVCRFSSLVNPGQPIPAVVQRIHGIVDSDVEDAPPFADTAKKVASMLVDSWIVGHNVRFDTGFLAMELQRAGTDALPLGCLDTCQLAQALWDFRNYKLETVVRGLAIRTTRLHRALDDTIATREIFHRMVKEVGGWRETTVSDLQKLHRYEPAWPSDPKGDLPKPLYDALTNGNSLPIRYVNAEGEASQRNIRPEASFASGRYTYIRAFCETSSEVRTFRLDRLVVGDATSSV